MCTHPQIFQHLKGHRLGPSLVTWHRGQTHPTYSRPHGRGLGGQAHGGTCTDDNDQSAQPRSAGRMGRKAEDDMSPRRHSPTLPNHHKEARFSHLGLPMLESPLHTMTRGPRNTERAGRSQARPAGRPKRQAPAQHARPSPARRAPSPGRGRSRGGARPAARTAASSRDSPVILGSRARLSEFKNISSHSGKSARPPLEVPSPPPGSLGFQGLPWRLRSRLSTVPTKRGRGGSGGAPAPLPAQECNF